jgi:hypothetical protein
MSVGKLEPLSSKCIFLLLVPLVFFGLDLDISFRFHVTKNLSFLFSCFFLLFHFRTLKILFLIGVPVITKGFIKKFPDWPPGARTANGTALCH